MQTPFVRVRATSSCRRNIRPQGFALAACLLVVAMMVLIGATDESSRAVAQMTARAAHTINGADTAHLRLVRPGERLLEEGPATGALPGSMRAELDIGPLYTGSFTIYTRNGVIRGSGRATPHGAGRYQSFAGWLTVTSGNGRYAHVQGHDQLYGVFDRRTYAVSVETTGTISY